MNELYYILPKDLALIVEGFSRDQTVYDNYDKVMQQLHMQSCVCDYGFYLKFRKSELFRYKFYSTLDDFSDWKPSGFCCRIDEPVLNCEGKLKVEKDANNY